MASFAVTGYEATSLDALGAELEVSKQTILYWYPSKEALLAAVIDRAAAELIDVVSGSLVTTGEGFDRVEAVVRSVFRIGARRPQVLGVLREATRLGPPAATQMTTSLAPMIERAAGFLEREMAVGRMRRCDPNLLLLAMYSTVLGMITEVEVLRALGEEQTARSMVRRRSDVLDLLKAALVVDP